MLEAGRFTLGAGFSRFGFHIGCFHIGGVFFHDRGFSHVFLTDIFADLEEEQGSGSSEHETTTESSMLPTTTIGI